MCELLDFDDIADVLDRLCEVVIEEFFDALVAGVVALVVGLGGIFVIILGNHGLEGIDVFGCDGVAVFLDRLKNLHVFVGIFDLGLFINGEEVWLIEVFCPRDASCACGEEAGSQ